MFEFTFFVLLQNMIETSFMDGNSNVFFLLYPFEDSNVFGNDDDDNDDDNCLPKKQKQKNLNSHHILSFFVYLHNLK